jgi:hypothetical protein
MNSFLKGFGEKQGANAASVKPGWPPPRSERRPSSGSRVCTSLDPLRLVRRRLEHIIPLPIRFASNYVDVSHLQPLLGLLRIMVRCCHRA